jgi:signal transduction histidine kinase/CheY-like chemotaxis protein
MNLINFDLTFPSECLRAALTGSLLSVWLLVGLFCYLNHYTKRRYFSMWTAAWLFYALWLTLQLNGSAARPGSLLFLSEQWCVAMSAVFLLWGSMEFLGLRVRQTLLGLFILFLVAWTAASPRLLDKALLMQLPVFILMGLGSIFAGGCFFWQRRKKPFVGAGMLSIGFLLWGIHLASYPIIQDNEYLYSVGFFLAAVLQLFIAISMIVLVLEEARHKYDQVLKEIVTVQSEKDALLSRALTTEQEYRRLFDQTRLTQGLQQAYDDLRRTQQSVVQQERLRALGQMASGITHDINNTLTPLLGYTELVLRTSTGLSAESSRWLQLVHKSGEDLAKTVTRMREFYRRRTENEKLVPVDVNALIEDVMELTRPRWRDVAQRQGIPILVNCSLQKPLPALLGDPSELREALTNLVFNAIDALPQGGVIHFVTNAKRVNTADKNGTEPNHIIIEVRDDGIGMDEKTRHHCLEPFFSTKTQRGGSGLGLAMVYGMVERHEGRIEIESAPGAGTSVRLIFPIAQAHQQTATRQTGPRAARPLRLLCIDDEPLVREYLTDSLTHLNHKVETAEGGREGLEMFRTANQQNQPYDVVITDLGMPEIDGAQVAIGVKAESPQTPVVLLTGWGNIMKEDGSIPPQVDAVLSKPPRLKDLNELLITVSSTSPAPTRAVQDESRPARCKGLNHHDTGRHVRLPEDGVRRGRS